MKKALNNQYTEKEPGHFQRFTFWVLIPLLFSLFLGLLIASIAGVNVFQKAKEMSQNVPFINNVMEKKEKTNIVEYEDRIISLDAEIQNKIAKIDQLQSQLENKEEEKERLLIKQTQLEQTIQELTQMRDENKRAFKEIVSIYESMAPKNAAPIILQMKDDEAVKILSNIRIETLAKIMEKMPPEKAAKYSEMIAVNAE